jgi:hypothetical protein
MLRLLMLGGIVCVAAYPTVANPPGWAWENLGSMSFVHSGQAQTYTTADLQLLTKFQIVQFDKKENKAAMPHVSAEDRFIAAARQVKAVSKRPQILMYLNGLINFPEFERLYNATAKNSSLLLHDGSGKLLKIRGNSVLDMQQPLMRKLFVDAALYGMASGVFNGVFIDRANWAQKCSWDVKESLVAAQHQLFVELTAALGEGNITLAKESSGVPANDWQVANAAMTSDTFCSSYCHECGANITPASLWKVPADAQNCADSIATIADMSARGQLTQVRACVR